MLQSDKGVNFPKGHILNVCAPNNRGLQYMRQKLIEFPREIDESPITVGDSNSPLSEMGRYSRQKLSKDIVEPSNTINQLDKIDTYGRLPPKRADEILFPSSHRKFTKEQKAYNVCSPDHSGIKREINNKKKTGESPNTWRLSNF